MELFIDDVQVDTDAGSEIFVSLSVAVVTDPRRGRAGYTRTLRLPATPANAAVFGYAAEVHARDRFNAAPHTGRVESEGCVLIEGPLTLSRACRDGSSGGFYEVHIIGAAKEWASSAAMHSLSTLSVGWSRTLSAAAISSSWTGSTPVRFLPVVRERLERDYSTGSVIPAAKVLSSDDYHPFIHAATLLRTIFAEAGYRVESDFIDSPFFDSLYISGSYPVRDVSVAKANMDFLARRFAAGSAIANSQGRVYADPYRTSYTVGNLVDTADPTRSRDGVAYDDVFANGGCFQMDDDRVAFIPSSAVSAGFQFHLRYTTDYRMKNRNELAGFDTVYLGGQAARTFTLTNPWPDRRSSFRPARTYSLAVFDHVAGRQYQLRWTQGGTTVNGTVADTRFSAVAVTGTQPVGDPALWYKTSPVAAWQPYPGDWALYDGMVGETGTLDVEFTVRTAPENITAGAPKFFDDIYFGGADPGMKITVGAQTWLRPVFYAQPAEGSALGFADVCAHDASRMDFIGALRQMFDLCFHTDNREKVVCIEPAESFYSDSPAVDLTDRFDLSKPVVVEELGGDLAREMVWSYRGGDGAVERFNRTGGGQFGRWSAGVENAAATEQVSVWENPMFTPSLNAAGGCPGAPSALLVQAGDSSRDALERTENLNFAPKIVRYEGMKPLPAGENWGWPLAAAEYPKLAFHAPESGYTLCFEDRDGQAGLHRMWERDVRTWNRGRRITAWLALEDADIESLSFPTGGGSGFRALYRLSIDGEDCLCRLEEVCDYTPGAPSTKCILITHIPKP